MSENAWKKYNDKNKIFKFCNKYKNFISKCKTERECINNIINIAKKNNFKDLNYILKNNIKLKYGDKIYMNNMNKSLILCVIGKKTIDNGMHIIGSHVDSPRIDIKQNPLYERDEQALLSTHYYGGIKKYQWVTIPMAIHGVVILKNGKLLNITIGEKNDDPVFGISDLLIHLSKKQIEKHAYEVIEAENMNVLVGNIPINNTIRLNPIKKNILSILNKKYKINENDFISAELEIVPSGIARDFGFDLSMIMAYGHDDKVCVYPSLMSIINTINDIEYTSVCLFVDKEEIGSVGPTSIQSYFFKNFVANIINITLKKYNDLILYNVLRNSKMLSADVSAAFDPNYPYVMDKKNSAFLGCGIVFNKYTGSRGKYGSNDANPEYIAKLRNIMNKNNISFQTAELGKVDIGGGGTIAHILGNYNIEVIDCGVPVLNMHAPWEIVSKVDIYETYRLYYEFLKYK